MARSTLRSLAQVLPCLLLLAVGPIDVGTARASAVRYTVTDLGTLGGTFSTAVGINGKGQIVGEAETADGEAHPFLWQEGEMVDLGTLGGPSGNAVDVNEAGLVVGAAETADGKTRAFLWQQGAMTDLGTLGGDHSRATRINNEEQVVGLSTTAPGQELGDPGTHAFLWQAGEMTDLGTLGGETSRANGINDAGQVVGAAQNADGLLRPFLWEDGTMTDLGSLPEFEAGRAIRINASGQVAGFAEVAGGVVAASMSADSRRGFVLRDDEMTDLGMLPGFTISRAYGLNDRGQVTGSLENSDEPQAAASPAAAKAPVAHAFFWEEGVLSDLNDLIPEGTGWELLASNGIANDGAIVGTGTIEGEEHAFLLTPSS